MSNGDNSKPEWVTVLNRWKEWIVGSIALVTAIYGFFKLWQGDTGLVTIIALCVGIVVLWLICLYFARFWKPELKDKSSAGLILPSSERIQAQKEKQRKRVRRSAFVGVFVIPILAIAGFFSWQYYQNLPTKEIIVLVAKFEGPEPQN